MSQVHGFHAVQRPKSTSSAVALCLNASRSSPQELWPGPFHCPCSQCARPHPPRSVSMQAARAQNTHNGGCSAAASSRRLCTLLVAMYASLPSCKWRMDEARCINRMRSAWHLLLANECLPIYAQQTGNPAGKTSNEQMPNGPRSRHRPLALQGTLMHTCSTQAPYLLMPTECSVVQRCAPVRILCIELSTSGNQCTCHRRMPTVSCKM